MKLLIVGSRCIKKCDLNKIYHRLCKKNRKERDFNYLRRKIISRSISITKRENIA